MHQTDQDKNDKSSRYYNLWTSSQSSSNTIVTVMITEDIMPTNVEELYNFSYVTHSRCSIFVK